MNAPTDSQIVAEAYLDAIVAIIECIGSNAPELKRTPAVDLNCIPASVIVAGQHAIKLLASGAGILDADPGSLVHLDPDDVLAAWTKNAGEEAS
jgi:hypothetical protein